MYAIITFKSRTCINLFCTFSNFNIFDALKIAERSGMDPTGGALHPGGGPGLGSVGSLVGSGVTGTGLTGSLCNLSTEWNSLVDLCAEIQESDFDGSEFTTSQW